MPIIAATEQPFKKLGHQVNKIFDQMQKGYYNFLPGETWTPNVNLYETEVAYVVCVDVSGVDKNKIDIEVEGNVLRIRGSRAVPACDDYAEEHADAGGSEKRPPKRVRVHLMEIDHGAFAREVELPHGVQQEQITAAYRNGILWIEVPK